MTKGPQTGKLIELDPVIGWQATTEQLSAIDPPGLAVDCVTGQPVTLSPALAAQLEYPIALAHGDGGRSLYLLDAAVNRIRWIDLEQQRAFVTVTGFGGKGRQPRRFRGPRGLAVLEDGSYVVADTGNHQVKIFSSFPNALLAVWGSGSPGSALGEFSSPWKVVADRCGLIHIADRGNGRVQRMRRDGTSEAPLAGFQSPSGLALGADGTLAVLDHPSVYIYPPAQNTPVQIVTLETATCITVDDGGQYLYVGTSTALVYKYEVRVRPGHVGPVGATQAGNLLVAATVGLRGTTALADTGTLTLTSPHKAGDETGDKTVTFTVNATAGPIKVVSDLLNAINADAVVGAKASLDATGRLNLQDPQLRGNLTVTGTLAAGCVGIGVTGVKGQFLDLFWTPGDQLVGILLPRCAPHPTLLTISTCGNYLRGGTLTTVTLDSGIENCVWDRVQLHATVPAGTLIKVATQTAESDIWATGAAFQPECSTYSADGQDCPLALTGDDPDCLVQSLPGRYLRMQLQLNTNGIDSPVLRAVQISFPRASYLQYLPAVYQEDDQSRIFLDRFLRIFQTTFDGMDRTIDEMWMRFDPLSVPDSWFAWLAAWIALPINPLWTNQERRAALKTAGQLYPWRGTPAGVQQLVQQYSGVAVRLIEHFRLRQLIILADQPNTGTTLGAGTRLWSRDYYQRLQLGVYSRVGYFALTGEPEPDLEPLAWGANEFTVFFDCEPYQVSATRQKVEQVVERETPAHTKANYAPVFPRMRIGVQSTLGVDTRIGEYTPLLLGTTGTLDYDSILSGSKTENQLQTQLRPRCGRRWGRQPTSVEEQSMSTSTAVCTKTVPAPQEKTCLSCEIPAFCRNSYYRGKLLTERDFTDEQRYGIDKMRLHTLSLHGWGVVCGLIASPHPYCPDRRLVVGAGLAVDDCGREIRLLADDYVLLPQPATTPPQRPREPQSTDCDDDEPRRRTGVTRPRCPGICTCAFVTRNARRSLLRRRLTIARARRPRRSQTGCARATSWWSLSKNRQSGIRSRGSGASLAIAISTIGTPASAVRRRTAFRACRSL